MDDLQQRLQQLGLYYGAVDGDFGRLTEGAVEEFQRWAGLVDDAIVGPLTWAALEASASYTFEAEVVTVGQLSADSRSTPTGPDLTGFVELPGHETSHVVHQVLEGTHVLGSVTEVLLTFGEGALWAEALIPIGEAATIVVAGWAIFDAMDTGETISHAQGYCYGAVNEVMGSADLAFDWSDAQLTDSKRALRDAAFSRGLAEGHDRARFPTVRNRLLIAIAHEGQGSEEAGAWSVLNALWHQVRPHMPKSDLTDEWLDWPTPHPYRPR